MYWLTGILGLALIAAPFGFSYTDNTNALWTSVILGAAVVLVSLYKAVMRDKANWEYWVAGAMGILALLAPFVLSFTPVTEALWACLAFGALMVILDGYEVLFAPPSTI